jgi:hypothetical protein
MKFLIVKTDYEDQRNCKPLGWFTEKYNALHFMEEYITSYLEIQNGISINNFKYYTDDILHEVKKDTCFIKINKHTMLHKKTIYKKICNKGLVYNSYIFDKLFSIDLIEIPSIRALHLYDCYHDDNDDYNYDQVIQQLKKINEDKEDIYREVIDNL